MSYWKRKNVIPFTIVDVELVKYIGAISGSVFTNLGFSKPEGQVVTFTFPNNPIFFGYDGVDTCFTAILIRNSN